MTSKVADCQAGDTVFVLACSHYQRAINTAAAVHASRVTAMTVVTVSPTPEWASHIVVTPEGSVERLSLCEGEFLRPSSRAEVAAHLRLVLGDTAADAYLQKHVLSLPAQKTDTSVGVKFDQDKPRMELLTAGMPGALLEIGKVLTFGSKKYADHNWKIVPEGDKRYAAAAMRHFLASQSGEVNDPETGLSHLAHMACCVLFLLQKELENVKNATK